jgi:hypothetical protein
VKVEVKRRWEKIGCHRKHYVGVSNGDVPYHFGCQLLSRTQTENTYDVRAYDLSPWDSSCSSKVPIHPRKDLLPFLEMVFHVTKSGDGPTAFKRRFIPPGREEEAGCGIGMVTVVDVDRAERDEFADRVEGVVDILEEPDVASL